MTASIHRIDKTLTNEAAEKGALLLERFTLVSDDDGHKFVLPLSRLTEFNEWLATDPESEEFNCDRFNEFIFEGGLLTFLDPAVN
jgi:hypothetical protein